MNEALGDGETIEMNCYGCGKRLSIERGQVAGGLVGGVGFVVRELLRPDPARPGHAVPTTGEPAA